MVAIASSLLSGKTPLSKRRDLSAFTILSNPENAKQNGYLAVGSAGRMR
jgi:hypothetical protein